APRIFLEGASIAASGGLLSLVVAIGMSVWRARETRTIETYGSARWATPRQVKRAGLLGPDGVVLGRYRRAYLRHDGPEHVLCFAPTRSGKGVGLVVPSLLTWSGSAIVHDIKGENWALTPGFRAPAMAGCFCSIRLMRHQLPTTPCWKCEGESGRFATFRTSPTSWSIQKARSNAGTTGKRPAIRCLSAPSFMSSTPNPTRRWPASPPSCPTPGVRSRRR